MRIDSVPGPSVKKSVTSPIKTNQHFNKVIKPATTSTTLSSTATTSTPNSNIKINSFKDLDSLNKRTTSTTSASSSDSVNSSIEVKSLRSFYEQLSNKNKPSTLNSTINRATTATVKKVSSPSQQQQQPVSTAKRLSIQKQQQKKDQEERESSIRDQDQFDNKENQNGSENIISVSKNQGNTPIKSIQTIIPKSPNKNSPLKMQDLMKSNDGSSNNISNDNSSAPSIAQKLRDTIEVYRNKISTLEEKLEITEVENKSLKEQLQLLHQQYRIDTCSLMDIINEQESKIKQLIEEHEKERKDQQVLEEQESIVERDPMSDSEEEEEEEEAEESESDDDTELEEEVKKKAHKLSNGQQKQPQEEDAESDCESSDFDEDEKSLLIEKLKEKIEELESEKEELEKEIYEAEEYCQEIREDNRKHLEKIDSYKVEIKDCQSMVIYYKEQLEQQILDSAIYKNKLDDKNKEILKYKERIDNFVSMMDLQKKLNDSTIAMDNNQYESTSSPTSQPTSVPIQSSASLSPLNRSSSMHSPSKSRTIQITTPTKSLSSSSLLSLAASNSASNNLIKSLHQQTSAISTPNNKVSKRPSSINTPSNTFGKRQSSLSNSTNISTPSKSSSSSSSSSNLSSSLNSSKRLSTARNSTLSSSSYQATGKTRTPRKVIQSPANFTDYI